MFNVRRFIVAGVWLAAGSCGFMARCDAAFLSLIPSADTTLIESAPTNSNGGEHWVNAGTTQTLSPPNRNRGLFRFDLTAIPTNAVVRSAALVLEVTRKPSDGYASNFFGLRRMFRPWGEGPSIATNNNGGLGAPALPGDTTWLHNFYPTSNWSAPGGLEGVDFAGFDSSSQFIEAKGSYSFESTPDMVGDVQEWVRFSRSNHGWMLLCSAEQISFTARRFGSREDLSSPPTLQVDYFIPPKIDAIQKTVLGCDLIFTAQSGQAYVVEYRDAISVGNWKPLTNLDFATATSQVTVTDTNAAPQRFYRLGTN